MFQFKMLRRRLFTLDIFFPTFPTNLINIGKMCSMTNLSLKRNTHVLIYSVLCFVNIVYALPEIIPLYKFNVLTPICWYCRDFEWSPTDNIISYWIPCKNSMAARVTLVRIPSRQVASVKNLFKVADCKMHWQKSGDFLCIKVDRNVKKRVVPAEEGEKLPSIVSIYYYPVRLSVSICQGGRVNLCPVNIFWEFMSC